MWCCRRVNPDAAEGGTGKVKVVGSGVSVQVEIQVPPVVAGGAVVPRESESASTS